MSKGKSGSMFARLSSKIYLAMGSILFLFTLVLGLFVYSVMMRGPGNRQSSPNSPLLAEQMKTSLLEAQRSVTLFLLHPHRGPAAEHNAAVAKLRSLAKQFAEIARQSGDGKNAARADDISNAVQLLDGAFIDLVQAREAKGVAGSSGLLEKLSSAGQQLEEKILENEVGSLALAFLRIQQHQQEYFKTSKIIDLRNLREAVNNFSRLLQDTGIEPIEAQVLRKGIKEYSSALDRYQAVSLATSDPTLSATLNKEQDRQADAIRGAANKIESVINRVNVPNALRLLLAIRQHEADYLLTADTNYVRQVNDGLDTLNTTFNNSSILQEQKKQVLASTSLYRDAFMSLVDQDAVITTLLARLNETRSNLETLIDAAAKTPPTTIFEKSLSFTASGNNLGMIAVAAGLAVLLIGLLITVLLGKSISAPIKGMTKIIRRINTSGDFNVEIPVNGSDETGQLAFEMNTLLRQRQAASGQTTETASEIVEKMKTLTDISHELKRQIEKIVQAGNSISGSMSTQNELAVEVNNAVSQLGAAAEDMNRILNQAGEQHHQITDTVDLIDSPIESTVAGIKAITGSSSQIADIITLSTEIAEQTSLLALNASVKAARAGSHGKEFGVIADEIAKLAQRSEELAKEANQLTGSLNHAMDAAIQPGAETIKSLAGGHEGGGLNLPTTEELAKQASLISTYTEKLGEVANSLAALVREIESMTTQQNQECSAALESITKLVKATSITGKIVEDEDAYTDATLQQAIGNIAMIFNEQEEKFRGGHTDEAAENATAAEDNERESVDDTGLAGTATDEDNREGEAVDTNSLER